jgi:HD superfamily phosphohydrolase
MKKLENLIHYNTLNQLDRAIAKSGQPCILSMTHTVIDYQRSTYRDLESTEAISRLDKIHQLGLANTCGYSACSSGTRLVHSLICASEIDRIAQENDLKDRELGIIAGMSHDIATPPFSDSVALGLNLNDEEQFEYVLGLHPDFDKILDKYAVRKKDLVEVVTGKSKSIMSQLINSKGSLDVDRWSYTIYDAWNLDLISRSKKPKKMRYAPLKNIVLRVDNRYVPNPFKHITIDDNKIVFNDMKNLSDTLELRIKMSTDVYNNPELLAREAFLENISKDMLEKGIINKESIFKMGDEDFKELVCKHGGEIGNKLFQFFKFQSYGTVDADEKIVREFLASNVRTPFAVKRQRKFNTAADSLVMVDGTVDMYRNWRPGHALSMEGRMSSLEKTFVYGLVDDDKLSKEVQKAQEKFG